MRGGGLAPGASTVTPGELVAAATIWYLAGAFDHFQGRRYMTDRSQMHVRLRHLHDDQAAEAVADLSPAERLGMMWQLAQDAWTFKGEPERAQSRLQRHLVRVYRGGR